MLPRRPISLIFIGLLILSLVFLGCGGSVDTSPSRPGKISGNYSGCATGAFLGSMESFSSFIASFESDTGKELAVAMWYVAWGTSFPEADCNNVRSYGAIPMITWEPYLATAFTLEAIATGEYDSYINDFAIAAKSWGKQLFLRPMHEPNGNWYPWSGSENGADAAAAQTYINAWRRIYNIFSGVGAKNVTVVWSVNHRSVPTNESWNQIGSYYPGDSYVDWVGADGYSWDGNSGEPTYETFSQLFSTVYATFEVIAPSKPMMVSELACAEGADKDTWITDAFNNLKGASFSKFKVFAWFNINKERDWRVNSDNDALTAYQNAVGDSYFIENIP